MGRYGGGELYQNAPQNSASCRTHDHMQGRCVVNPENENHHCEK